MSAGRALAGLVAVGVISIAGCSGGSSGPNVAEKQVSTTTTAPKPTGLETVRVFFKALATADPAEMKTMINDAVPGSTAAKYATVQTAYAEASVGAGTRNPPAFYSEDGDTIRTCSTSPTASTTTTSVPGPKDCTVFSDFVVDKKTHQLADFKADKIDIATRIVTGGAPQGVLGATITPVGAYRTVQSDSLVVIFDVTAGNKPIDVSTYSASYITSDGRQVAPDAGNSVIPATTVQPTARVRYVSVYPSADVGGHLALPLTSGSPDYASATVNIPVTNG